MLQTLVGLVVAISLLAGCSAPTPSPLATLTSRPRATVPLQREVKVGMGSATSEPSSSVTPTTGPSVRITPEVSRPSPVPTSAVPTGSDAPVRPSYRLDVVSDPKLHRASVRMELVLNDPIRLATGQIVFNLPANHFPGVFTLRGAQINGEEALPASSLDDTVLRVRLPQDIDINSPLRVAFDFALALPPASEAGISAVHALAWSELGELLGYWHPVLAPYDPQDGWQIVPYHPVGDPMIYEASDYLVNVEAPAGFSVIGSVDQGQFGASRSFRLLECRGFALIISDRLELTETVVGGVPVKVFHNPAHSESAAAVARAAAEALPLFSVTYGPFPYEELLIVEAEQFGGMEYSGLITFSSAWFADYSAPAADAPFGADYLVRFVVHEIGHQWWYGGVGNNQAREPWLDEALARYGEWLYYDRLHPEWLSWWESPSRLMDTLPIDRPIYDFADTAGYVQAVYVSGTRFLLDLQAMVGVEPFQQLLQRYYRGNRGELVRAQTFLDELEKEFGPAVSELSGAYFATQPFEGRP